MNIFKIVCFLGLIVTFIVYCAPLFHIEHSQALKSQHDRINQRDPINRAFYDKDIHYESTPLNPETREFLNERVDPRAPINPNANTLQKLATQNKESPVNIYKGNRTFQQNYVPGGVRTHSD